MDHVIGGKFKLGRKIGSGSFGELYLGMHFIKVFCSNFEFNSCDLFLVLLFISGVNVQSGEEVAVKLVSAVMTLMLNVVEFLLFFFCFVVFCFSKVHRWIVLLCN